MPIMDYVMNLEVARDIERGRQSLIVPCKQAAQYLYSTPERVEGAVGHMYCSEPIFLMLMGWMTAKDADDLHQLIFAEMERRYGSFAFQFST